MLKEGESETIADYQSRFVFNPKAPLVNKADKPLYFVDHTSYLKAVGKI